MIKLIVGDWSDDGHGKTDTFVCEADHDNVMEAYKAGVTKLGIPDIIKDYCRDYGSWYFPADLAEKLGLEIDPDDLEDGRTSVNPYSWADMFIDIVNAGDETINLKLVPVKVINIGGYGLYD